MITLYFLLTLTVDAWAIVSCVLPYPILPQPMIQYPAIL